MSELEYDLVRPTPRPPRLAPPRPAALPELPLDLLLEDRLTATEAAAYLKIQPSSFYRLLRPGPNQIPHIKLGRAIQVPRAWLVDYLADRARGIIV